MRAHLFPPTLLSAAVLFAAVLSAQTPSDETAIRDTIRKYAEARDNADAKATEALFTADADQLVSSGEWRQGRAALVKGAMSSSKKETGKRLIGVDTVRFLAPGVAITDGPYETTSANGTVRRMRTCFVLTKGKDGWKIAAIRNMLPAPPAN
ncbi:MAG: SgcJ/EcaC family oxidoreductase [Acidobacteria bacterium]|nr:SgcJ/EcaC family oxidoreductase [Acidobacteriota bacterium]